MTNDELELGREIQIKDVIFFIVFKKENEAAKGLPFKFSYLYFAGKINGRVC